MNQALVLIKREWDAIDAIKEQALAGSGPALAPHFLKLRELYSEKSGPRGPHSGHGTFEKEIERRGYKPRTGARVHVRTKKSSKFHVQLHALGLGEMASDYENQSREYKNKAIETRIELKQLTSEKLKELLQ